MKTLFTLSLALLFLGVRGQIPNFNFELWSNGVQAAPDGWEDHGSNHAGFYPATQTTDKYIGSFAVRLENKITATDTTKGELNTTRPNGVQGFGAAFQTNTRYSNLKGFYKFVPLNGDSAQFIVRLSKNGYSGQWGDMLAWGSACLPAAPVYAPFSIGYLAGANFLYLDNVLVPDSGYICMAAFKFLSTLGGEAPPLGNSVLTVDALNFDSYLFVPGTAEDITAGFSLYPSSGNGLINVDFALREKSNVAVTVYDLQGREVKKLFAGELLQGRQQLKYNLSVLSGGQYMFVIASDKGYKAEYFSIEK